MLMYTVYSIEQKKRLVLCFRKERRNKVDLFAHRNYVRDNVLLAVLLQNIT